MILVFLVVSLSVVLGTKLPANSRSINVALETSFLFDSENDRQYLPVLKNVKTIIDTLYDALSQKPSLQRRAEKDDKDIDILPNFVKNLGDVILKYDDDDFKRIIEYLNEQIEGFYRKKTTSHDPVIHNAKLRELVKNKINEWMLSSSEELKRTLRYYLENLESSPLLKYFSEFFNATDEVSLDLFLSYFKGYLYEKTIFKLSSLVKDISRFVIFDRYNNLDDKTKAKIQNDVENMFGNTVVTNDVEKRLEENELKYEWQANLADKNTSVLTNK